MRGSVDTREQGMGQNIVTQRIKRESKSRKDKRLALCWESMVLLHLLINSAVHLNTLLGMQNRLNHKI